MRQAQVYNETNLRVDFDPDKFNSRVQEKGINVLWEKMAACPCRKDITSQAISNCVNCQGTGFTFYDSKQIRAMISGASGSKNFQQWSEVLQGTVNISVDPYYKLGWYDKIVVIDADTVFSEQKLIETSYIAQDGHSASFNLHYPVLEVSNIFKFNSELSSLETINLSLVTINLVNRKNITIQYDFDVNDKISINYLYNPTYLIIDLLNDYRNTYTKFKRPEEFLGKMPIRALAKKLHLVLV